MRVLIFVFAYLFNPYVYSEQFNTLYNLSLGDSIDKALNLLGQPSEVVTQNNAVFRAFIKENHYIVIMENPSGSNFISSIQVTGVSQPTDTFTNKIGLGVSIEKVIQDFGEPSSSKPAIDQITQDPVSNTDIHYFGENISLETQNGLVTSIRIQFDETHSSDSEADRKNFEATMPEEIQLVQDYILNTEYPEVFNEEKYRISVSNFKIIDLDFDNQNDVVVSYKPHYTQSPTIVLFKIDENKKVTRVTEGFAPGPLVQRGDYFLDPHSTDKAIDIQVKEEKKDSLIGAISLKSTKFTMAIDYPNFTHLDMREGFKSYINLTHVNEFVTESNCYQFEFSYIENMFVGYIEGEKKEPFISSIIGEKMYTYIIHNIDKEGFINKSIEVTNLKKDD
ncbi:hypothetical protein NBRC116188_17310 [Oceaniserpentilla sp. 4NH20-0058]|uniref:hypothetical protein n=1 Tax=Oceaniserpentilla sp. 4NH20-0058 TaxID=3127660 RepID=UPI003108D9CB